MGRISIRISAILLTWDKALYVMKELPLNPAAVAGERWQSGGNYRRKNELYVWLNEWMNEWMNDVMVW